MRVQRVGGEPAGLQGWVPGYVSCQGGLRGMGRCSGCARDFLSSKTCAPLSHSPPLRYGITCRRPKGVLMLSRTSWLGMWVMLTAVACLSCQLSVASRQALGAQASTLPTASPPPPDPLPSFQWQRLHTTEGLMASLTVVPPAVVTQNQLVELRLGLRSTSVHPQTVTVQFYINRVEDTARVMLQERAVTLEPLATQLVSASWAPAAFHGRTALLAVVTREGQRIAQPNWSLMILPPFDHAHGRKYASAP